MSASVLLKFEPGEIKKVKEWFAKVCPADRYPDLPVPESPHRNKEYTRGIYVTFRSNVMELDRAIWDEVAGCYATLIGQELSKRFKLKAAGWDSIGYCDKIEDFMNSTGLLSRVYRKRAAYIKASMTEGYLEAEVLWREKAEKFFKQKAIELVGR